MFGWGVGESWGGGGGEEEGMEEEKTTTTPSSSSWGKNEDRNSKRRETKMKMERSRNPKLTIKREKQKSKWRQTEGYPRKKRSKIENRNPKLNRKESQRGEK